MPGKIGIKIPSHNSLTVSFLDELLRTAATSRKLADARKIRRRLPEKYHIAIVSTGLSYLAYLGALKKVQKGYKPTRLGKKIGKLLAQGRIEEANAVWSELLKHHKLFRIFKKFFSIKDDKHGTLEDFSLYLRKRTHAKWDISTIRSRVSRLCELFAEKELIEYQNGILSLLDIEEKEIEVLSETSRIPKQMITLQTHTSKERLSENVRTKPTLSVKPARISMTTDSWPIKIEIKIEVSDRANSDVIAMILSFLKDMRKTDSITSMHTNGGE